MRTLSILSLFILMASKGLAYGPCDADAQKLCASGELHAETTKNCLHFNSDQVVDPSCKDFLERERGEWQKAVDSFTQVRTACKVETEKFCPELVNAERKLKAQQTCLMSEGEKLGAECKKAMNRHIKEHQSNLREIP